MYTLGQPKKRSSGTLKLLLFLVILGGLAVGGVFTMRAGEEPQISMEVKLPAIGPKTPLTVLVSEPVRGPVSISVVLDQEGDKTTLFSEERTPRPWHDLLGDEVPVETIELTIDKKTNAQNLVQGEAQIVVEVKAAGTWAIAGPAASKSVRLPVKLIPPTLEVKSSHIYPTQGGAEVVVYQVGEGAEASGVRAGKWWFEGYPLPNGGDNDRFALFAVPYDMDKADGVKLVARDDVGNEMAIDFIDKFTPKTPRRSTIRVSDDVMKKVVPKIMGKTPAFKDRGALVKNYVAINSEMRKANNAALVELSKKSKPEFMWNRSFVQMEAQVLSTFADRRTYYHGETEIDRQDHLGFDLASTRKAPIPSANRGVVVMADYHGIYGHTVVVDHGYGLMSLYAHLSSYDVKVGDKVERGQTVGRTGATGLALGDHLHFTMMLAGLPVTPLEWWDDHWVHDRLALKLGDALGYVRD